MRQCLRLNAVKAVKAACWPLSQIQLTVEHTLRLVALGATVVGIVPVAQPLTASDAITAAPAIMRTQPGSHALIPVSGITAYTAGTAYAPPLIQVPLSLTIPIHPMAHSVGRRCRALASSQLGTRLPHHPHDALCRRTCRAPRTRLLSVKAPGLFLTAPMTHSTGHRALASPQSRPLSFIITMTHLTGALFPVAIVHSPIRQGSTGVGP